MSDLLVEKWKPMVESEKARKVKDVRAMSQLLENQERYITEASSTLSDFAQFTPLLIPAVRRIFPNLLANEIVGVQAMNGPTGYAFALRYGYAGAGGKKDLNGSSVQYPTGARGVQGNSQLFTGFAFIANSSSPSLSTVVVGWKLYYGSTLIGTVAHTEGANKFLIDLSVTGTHYFLSNKIYAVSGNTLVGAATGTDIYGFGNAASSSPTITGVDVDVAFANEAGYNLIFSSYIPSVTSAAGEVLGRSSMKTMKLSIEKFPIEAQTRKLKGEISNELITDLQKVHGEDAEARIIEIMEYEIAAELDRELVEAIYSVATVSGTDWTYGAVGAATGTADGRFELEKFRSLYTRIVREANALAISTRKGAGNFVICSINVATALQCLPNFMYSSVPGNVEVSFGVAKIGTLDGKYSVYLDTFAYADFFTVGYKGPNASDSGIIYCPYVPLMMQKIVDPDTLQPVIGMQVRDAIAGNAWGADKYYRTVKCNFAGSSLISGNYFI